MATADEVWVTQLPAQRRHWAGRPSMAVVVSSGADLVVRQAQLRRVLSFVWWSRRGVGGSSGLGLWGDPIRQGLTHG